jgi:Domain of unknown function (DUF4833)
MPARTMHRLLARAATVVGLMLMANVEAGGRELTSQVTELDHIPSVRAEFPVPSDPNMLFYIQRSVNANTVVYTAHFDSHGRIDPDEPVDVYWKWYNVDGQRKPINFIERVMAYGVKSVAYGGSSRTVSFKVAALPERELLLGQDDHGRAEALTQFGDRTARLIYVYLQVDDSGLLPSVTAMDLFGIDKLSGKPLREHVIPR